MPSVRIEFIKVSQRNEFSPGADNVVSEILLAQDLTVTGSAANSSAAPSETQAVRLTSIGGIAYVNNKATATAVKSLRLADGQSVVLSLSKGKTVSAMVGA